MLSRKQQAAVLYLAIPKEERTMGMKEFSEHVLQVNDRTVRTWYENKEFSDAVKKARAQYLRRSGDLYEKAARSKALMIMMKGMDDQTDLETQRKFASSVLREVKEVREATDTVSYQASTDEQLIAEMFSRGLDLPAAELSKFRDLIGLEDLT